MNINFASLSKSEKGHFDDTLERSKNLKKNWEKLQLIFRPVVGLIKKPENKSGKFTFLG